MVNNGRYKGQRVNVVHAHSAHDLAELVNKFMENNEVTDLQYSTHSLGNTSHYSCMITYKIK